MVLLDVKPRINRRKTGFRGVLLIKRREGGRGDERE
jgi:hypothetical protein